MPRSVKATAAGRPEVTAAAATPASTTVVAVPSGAKPPPGNVIVDAEVSETGPDAHAESSEAVGGPGAIGPSGSSELSLLPGAEAEAALEAGPDEGQHHGPGSASTDAGGAAGSPGAAPGPGEGQHHGPGSGAAVVLTRSDRKRQWKQLRRDKKARRRDPEAAAEEATPAPTWIPGE